MLHKYYLNGVSNRWNLKFYSETADDGEWTMPDICHDLRAAITEAADEHKELYAVLNGYKQYLYLQKSENTKRYWKVVIGIWRNRYDCENGFEPFGIIRITTDNLTRLVEDKRSGALYEELPLSIWYHYHGRMFY